MDAADDPDDAQLCWLRKPSLYPLTCSAAALDGNAFLSKDFSSKGLFDVFKLDESGVSEDVTLADVPATVTQFNLAAGDLGDSPAILGFKQYQDDMSTRLPWADVEDENDPSGYRIFDTIAEEATADADSQECRTQCGPSDSACLSVAPQAHLQSAGSLMPQLGHLGPGTAVEKEVLPPAVSVLQDSQNSRTQCGPSPFACTPPVSQQARPQSAGDEMPQHEHLGPIPAPVYLQDDFQQHARLVLPDVYATSSVSDSEAEEDPGTSLDEVPFSVVSPTVTPGGSLTSRTQCGPLPLEFDHGFFPAVDLDEEDNLCTQDAPCTGLSSDSTQARHAPLATETQCGPLPQPPTLTPFKDQGPLNLCTQDALCIGLMLGTTQAQYAPLATEAQCGPLPQNGPVLDFEGYSVFDLDEAGNLSTQYTTLAGVKSPQLGTTASLEQAQYAPLAAEALCGPLPQPLDDGGSLGSLQPSLDGFAAARASTAQLLEASMSGDWNARIRALQAYEAATHVLHTQLEQFEVVSKDILSLPSPAHVPILADDRPQRVISLADALGVQGEGCAPIPEEETSPTQGKDQYKIKKRRHGRRRSSRTSLSLRSSSKIS